MKNNYRLISACILFLAMVPGMVSAQFNISAEFRFRPEYRDGYQTIRDNTQKPYVDILGRARALFDYSSDRFSTRLNLQGAWVFGQNTYSSDTVTKNTVNLYEAWFRYAFTKGFALKIGRIELSYDDQRFIGMSNWTNYGASHDVLVAQWEVEKVAYKGDFGFAVNNMAPSSSFLSSYNVRGNYKYLGYLWEQKKFFKNKLNLTMLAIVDAFQKPGTPTTHNDTLNVYGQDGTVIGYTIIPTSTTKNYPDQLYARATVGLNGTLTVSKWNFFLSGYYQGGHYKDGKKINAWFYSIWLQYQPIKLLAFKAGFDHLSGNNFSNSDKLKTTYTGLSTMYGTAHSGYGYMDLWSAYVKDNIYAGLNDLYARATVSFTDQMYLEVTWRWFSLPYKYLNVADPVAKTPYTEVSKSLGNEIDLMYMYKPFKNFDVSGGYCFMLPTKTMELQRGLAPGSSQFAQFAYVQVTYKPNFYNSEKK